MATTAATAKEGSLLQRTAARLSLGPVLYAVDTVLVSRKCRLLFALCASLTLLLSLAADARSLPACSRPGLYLVFTSAFRQKEGESLREAACRNAVTLAAVAGMLNAVGGYGTPRMARMLTLVQRYYFGWFAILFLGTLRLLSALLEGLTRGFGYGDLVRQSVTMYVFGMLLCNRLQENVRAVITYVESLQKPYKPIAAAAASPAPAEQSPGKAYMAAVKTAALADKTWLIVNGVLFALNVLVSVSAAVSYNETPRGSRANTFVVILLDFWAGTFLGRLLVRILLLLVHEALKMGLGGSTFRTGYYAFSYLLTFLLGLVSPAFTYYINSGAVGRTLVYGVGISAGILVGWLSGHYAFMAARGNNPEVRGANPDKGIKTKIQFVVEHAVMPLLPTVFLALGAIFTPWVFTDDGTSKPFKTTGVSDYLGTDQVVNEIVSLTLIIVTFLVVRFLLNLKFVEPLRAGQPVPAFFTYLFRSVFDLAVGVMLLDFYQLTDGLELREAEYDDKGFGTNHFHFITMLRILMTGTLWALMRTAYKILPVETDGTGDVTTSNNVNKETMLNHTALSTIIFALFISRVVVYTSSIGPLLQQFAVNNLESTYCRAA